MLNVHSRNLALLRNVLRAAHNVDEQSQKHPSFSQKPGNDSSLDSVRTKCVTELRAWWSHRLDLDEESDQGHTTQDAITSASLQNRP
mmetsp:Transcript_35060/g.87313  ORF Transcript_35060/g.87313 Transcript_35060/m.87313 type:complete len:87 (-) Transcript_35060:703-963(-)